MIDGKRQALARRLRRNTTSAEGVLWKLLRSRRMEGLKFRRQVPLGRYVADFACFRHRLIVEADGPFHEAERDHIRDAWLATQGFRVLRFSNEHVQTRPHEVIAAILEASRPSGDKSAHPILLPPSA